MIFSFISFSLDESAFQILQQCTYNLPVSESSYLTLAYVQRKVDALHWNVIKPWHIAVYRYYCYKFS